MTSVGRVSHSAIPVSLAAPLAPLLAGPPRPATVLAALSQVVVLAVETDCGGRIVSLLGPTASGVPHGVRLTTPERGSHYLGALPGQRATVGAQRIVLGSLELQPVRSWRTAVPSIRPRPSRLTELASRLADADLGVAVSRVSLLKSALRAGDPASAVRGLIGLGIGLTPGGDDIVAGLLVGLRAAGKPVLLQQVRRAVGSRLAERTTAISADLLRLAAAGHASLEVLGLLAALHHHSADRLLAGSIDRLLAVGHTSGADLATGILLGLSSNALPRSTTQQSLTTPRSRGEWSMSQ